MLLWLMPVTFTVAPCRAVAEFPVDVASTDPIHGRARFELRRCVDEIDVASYEDQKKLAFAGV
ncbi:MAG TPA: hypothetical protein VMJ34_17990 [Bryobacteraceae bacterium]|nr:hypothetical protein [Bryobacteraceae bacterium]